MDDRAYSPSIEKLREDFRGLEHASAMVRSRDGTIRFWGRGMERLYGYTSHEAIGQSSHKLLRTEFPRPLADILILTGVREGADAAVKQYRDLRSQYFGRGSYDFGEDTLLNVARRLANARPEVAIPLAELNLEFFPKSVNSLVTKAIAQSGHDDEAAVATLKRALELDPDNGEIKGRLYQIEEMLARRKRFATPQ